MKNYRIKFFLSIVAYLFSLSYTFASYISVPLSYYAMQEDQNIIVLKVLHSQIATSEDSAYIDAEITHQFRTQETIASTIRIPFSRLNTFFHLQLTEGSQWLTVLKRLEDTYIIPECTPALPVEHNFITDKTGLNILDNSPNKVSLGAFKLAMYAYQQGIASADKVCKSDNTYCVNTKATYDTDTGLLSLPTVQYSEFGIPTYANATLQKTSDNPTQFTVTELK